MAPAFANIFWGYFPGPSCNERVGGEGKRGTGWRGIYRRCELEWRTRRYAKERVGTTKIWKSERKRREKRINQWSPTFKVDTSGLIIARKVELSTATSLNWIL
jgi:hypothetical protein